MFGVAVIIAVLAGVAAFASAQIATNPPPVANPPLTAECGLKVMLVLDASASIISPTTPPGQPPLGNQTATVRNAANAFVNALEGTGSHLGTLQFWNRGYQGIPYQEVDSNTANAFHAWINGTGGPNPYNPSTANTATNWEDGLRQAAATPGGPPDLVLFVTDGEPNTYNTGPGTPPSNTMVSTGTSAAAIQTALNRSVAAANTLKTAPPAGAGPSRIFAIGVGPSLAHGEEEERLQTISGPTPFTGAGNSTFSGSDFSTVSFDQLQSEMTGIVSELCGSRLLLTKEVPDHNGELTDAAGWRFTATLDPAHEHTWLHPTHGTEGNATDASATLTTANNGIADFQWRLLHLDTNPHVTVSVSKIHEAQESGFHFVVAECHDVGPDGVIESSQVVSTTGIPGATLGREDFRTCRIVNRPSMAKLTVVKRLEPSDDPGRFNLEVGGQIRQHAVSDGGSTGPITLPLGHHEVSESGADGTELSDYHNIITCVDLAHNDRVIAHTNGEAELSVPLDSDGQDVVCTIENIRTELGEHGRPPIAPDLPGRITVIKHLVPEHDPGRFNLLLDGDVWARHVTDGGKAGPIPVDFGTHHVTEQASHGTDLGHYAVSTTCINENTGETVAHNAHGPAVSVHVSEQDDNVQCTIQNVRHGVKVARLEVVKHLVPHNDAGRFNLLVGGTAFAVGIGDHGSTGPLGFKLGTHRVTERAAGRTHLGDFATSTNCVDRAHHNHRVAHNAHGPAVSVHLRNESDDVVCTITNRRIAPPGEGGGQAATPSDFAPHLVVVKSTPTHAQVGEVVPITITVHNHGHGTAHGVQLHDAAIAGMRIVHVADHGALEHKGGAVWHLGDLAHGASRTVHATARVLHTGSHVDTAAATARNADPALSVGRERATAATRRRTRPTHPTRPHPPRHRHPPRFTG